MLTNETPLKDDFRATGFLAPIAKWMNQVSRRLNNVSFVSGGDVLIRSDGIFLRPRSGDFPRGSRYNFGYTLSGDKITVYGGSITRGDRSPISVADADKTITLDQSYVGIKYIDASETLTIENFGTTEPVSTQTEFKVWLYLLTLTTIQSSSKVSITVPGGINVIPAAVSIAARFGG